MPADLILTRGAILTLDEACPRAEAAAISGGKFLAVGSSQEIEAAAGAGTRVVDLGGRFVLPGFIDSHVHFIQGGRALASVQLRDVRARDELADRLKAHADGLPKGAWILEGNWDHQQFPGAVLPTKAWIDGATPEHPVCISRLDGHMVLCNSLALRLAHIDRHTLPMPGGEIVHDPATGEPTGILKDAVAEHVLRCVPPPSLPELRRMAEASLAAAARKGVTSVHDVSAEAGFEAYLELAQEGRLTSRLSMYAPITMLEAMLALKLRSGMGSNRLRFAGLKGFADGSLGSGTAWFYDAYLGEPENRGLAHSDMLPEGIMQERILAATRAGLQVAIHAIGDQAIARILDIFEAADQTCGAGDRRFRLEHAQHVLPSDFARFARHGVIASVQPYHAIDDGCWAERMIGDERAGLAFPYRTFLQAGVRLAFGSDWPVAPMDPLLGIHAAVTRMTLDGRHPGGWHPEQKVPLMAALHASTLGGAYAEFAEGRKGSITPGKLADLVVLDRDLLAIPPEEIQAASVALTVCGGAIVFQDMDI